MKRIIVSMLAVALGMCVHAAEDLHTFTDTQGRELRAKILDCDAERQTVTIKTENGRKATVPIAGFSESDQEYIQEWMQSSAVRSESKFIITCETDEVESWKEDEMGTIRIGNTGTVEEEQIVGQTRYDRVVYEITLNNRNDSTVSGIQLKYCIFYQQEVNRSNTGGEGVLCGEIAVDPIEKFKKAVVATDSVVIYESNFNGNVINASDVEGEVLGIVVRVCTAGEEGGEVLREVCFPDNILKDHSWQEESSPVGVNGSES